MGGYPTRPPESAAETAAETARLEAQEKGAATRVLFMATFGFTVFFAVWVMFAIVAIPVKKQFALSEGDFAFLVAIPILTGSILRIPIGLLTDRVGGRLVFTALLVFTAVPTYLVSRATSFTQLIVLAFFVGVAGTSFAVGIAWVSAWFPARRQGFALGMFGAGNVGASVTKLLAPTLVTLVGLGGVAGGAVPGGWRLVPFVYTILLLATAVLVWTIAPGPDHKPATGRTFADVSAPLRVLRVWRFGLYYIVVFGGYVALSLWLPHYYVDNYGLELRDAGFLTALFIFPASLLRPLGGHLSDRFGARPVTYTAFVVMCLALGWLSFGMEIVQFTALVVVVGVMMGLGKASVYKYIADYFPRDVGAAGGVVGAVGGLGGFVLPLLFAWAHHLGGRPQTTFLVLLCFSVFSLICLHVVVVKMLRDQRRHARTIDSREQPDAT